MEKCVRYSELIYELIKYEMEHAHTLHSDRYSFENVLIFVWMPFNCYIGL